MYKQAKAEPYIAKAFEPYGLSIQLDIESRS